MNLSREPKDWNLIINQTFPTIPANRIIHLGWQFIAHYLMVQVSTQNQQDSWHRGGTLWATSFVKGYNTRFLTKELDLYAQELIIVPNLFNEKYSISYRVPNYFTNVTLKIWGYVGVIEDDILVAQNKQILAMLQEILDKIGNDNRLEENTGIALFTGFI